MIEIVATSHSFLVAVVIMIVLLLVLLLWVGVAAIVVGVMVVEVAIPSFVVVVGMVRVMHGVVVIKCDIVLAVHRSLKAIHETLLLLLPVRELLLLHGPSSKVTFWCNKEKFISLYTLSQTHTHFVS